MNRKFLISAALGAALATGTTSCKKDAAPAEGAAKPAGPEGAKPAEGAAAEGAAAEGGAKPAEGGDKAAAAEGGEKAAEGGDKAAAAGEKPAEGGDKKAEGGEKPAEGGDKKAEGGDKPAEGGEEKPAEGGEEKPAEGGDKPAEGGDKPADPAAAPKEEQTEEAEEPENKDPLAAPPSVAAPPASAIKTASGLASKVIKEGKSERMPSADDTVRVHYTGWTTDGKMFDSSIPRGEPTTFPLNAVIAGWTEGVQLMKVGEKRRFWIPEGLAYQGRPGAPAGMLVFDVELLDILEKPKAPPDVAQPPADAERTPSGLASKVIKAGTGQKRPAATDMVQVHYSGWTTDGKMFDSSVARGEPAMFPLNRVIPGWTEGVGLMVEGEKRRLWIPEELAYKGRPGAPAGMLVFDVELLKVMGPR
jgi:FKBP-type peptidyl-prolyl cis-trans isomerase